jgi:DNA-binding response OmpR family regulator
LNFKLIFYRKQTSPQLLKMQRHREHAEKIGINRYLGKPFNETELLENIHALLENRPVALMV